MKKLFILIIFVFVTFVLVGCKVPYRDFDDSILEDIAVSEYAIDEFLFFKIVDSETAKLLTGTAYENSGVIYGKKDNSIIIIFVPKDISEPTIRLYSPLFDIDSIYAELKYLKDTFGNPLFIDSSGDYGGLSITISPYEDVTNNNSSIIFDSKIFLQITSETSTFYIGISSNKELIFDESFHLIKIIE